MARALSKSGIVSAIAIACATYAVAEKTVAVKIQHSAALERVLAGRQVTFGRLSGDCAKEFADLLRRDMLSHGISVISQAELGQALAISIDATRCEAHPLPPIMGSGLPATHISRTEGHFFASLRVTDPATGQDRAVQALRGDAQQENQSQTLAPEYPAVSDVKQMAILQALPEARRLYVPWIETRAVPIMDNKECNLKAAYELAKSGDYQGFLRQSRANVESCGASSKGAGEAWYNLGVAAMLERKYQDALDAFAKAHAVRHYKPAEELVEICQAERAAEVARTPPPSLPPKESAPSQTGIVMTNDFIIKLVQGNVDDAEILKMIAGQPGRFSLAPEDLLKLHQAGVSDAVIQAMRNKK